MTLHQRSQLNRHLCKEKPSSLCENIGHLVKDHQKNIHPYYFEYNSTIKLSLISEGKSARSGEDL